MAGIGPAPRRAVAAEDVRDLQLMDATRAALQAGGSACVSVMRSSGLMTCWIVLVATRA